MGDGYRIAAFPVTLLAFLVYLININVRLALSAIAENENCLYQMCLSSTRSSVMSHRM
jgi:hypothetical protein